MPSSLGPAEILVILVVALIVLGPNKLPDAARQVGKTIAEVRRWSQGLQDEIRTAIDPELAPPYPEPVPQPTPVPTLPAETPPAETPPPETPPPDPAADTAVPAATNGHGPPPAAEPHDAAPTEPAQVAEPPLDVPPAPPPAPPAPPAGESPQS